MCLSVWSRGGGGKGHYIENCLSVRDARVVDEHAHLAVRFADRLAEGFDGGCIRQIALAEVNIGDCATVRITLPCALGTVLRTLG
jgi:hypothetical protein